MVSAAATRIERVLQATAPDLLAFFERRIEPRADAADLLTETMLTAWRRADDLPDDDEGARRWLFGIAHNVLLNGLRGVRRRSRLASRVRGLLNDEGAPAADEGGEVRDALRRLAPDLAEIVTLVHWEGLPLVDVAAIVGIPVSTARRRYLRAKDELRAALTAVAAGS
jgi:RNA polymerase sigma-70 factor (ECF subfamily)